jgi:hypothetical protein
MASHIGCLKPYLNVLDNALVAEFPFRTIPRRRERIGRDVQERAIAGIGDVQRSNRNLRTSALESHVTQRGYIHRVWSRRYKAPFSPALLLTAPMPEDAAGACREGEGLLSQLTSRWSGWTDAGACRGPRKGDSR